jgi:PAS domain S-box-containing protein
MEGSHDISLVGLSVTVAAVASYTALDLASRVRAAVGGSRYLWLGAAAVAMGGGIWSMHFIAMLAFSMPMPVSYDITLTVASLLLAIAVTGIGFIATAGPDQGPVRVALSGMLMGFGIAGMHYLGMAAMRMDADLSHDPTLVAVSILIAIGASTVALHVAFRNTYSVNRAFAASAMGLAISGMHYTAMVGSVFSPRSMVDHAHGVAGFGQTQLALAVAAATLLILLFALIAAMFDRRFGEFAEREAEALRASELRFRQFYREAPVPLHALDETGTIVQVSDAWLDLLCYQRDAVVGRPLTDFLSEASKLNWSTAHSEIAKDRQQGEYQFLSSAGVSLAICVDERKISTGSQVLLLGGLTDLTSRRRAEADLRQAQKLEAIGQLTGGLAHDFNNLLSVVLGNVELLTKRVQDDPSALKLTDGIDQAARRGAALTQRMLAFARKQELRPELIGIPDLVRGMADLLSRSLGPTVEVVLRFPLSLPKVYVDKNQLELALLNLAVNARDAMPGGGRLTISAAAEADGTTSRKFVRLSIEDTGEGMEEEVLARAVDPFFTTKGLGKGTGLGLSMVQGMAAQSGGRFVLESQKGVGTTANLWLPVADTAQLRPSPPADVEKPSGNRNLGGLAILVVDDDPLVLMGTLAMLEDLGATPLEALSGSQALELIRSGSRVDILVTDYAMPRMNGLELAREARGLRPGLPIVLASGYAEHMEAGAVDVVRLAKPFQQSALQMAIDEAASRRASKRYDGLKTNRNA